MASGRRLELSWSNKDMRLLSHGADRYEWVQPTDWRVSEVRLLEEIGDFGEDPEDNLVVHGDALHALTSLTSTPGLAEAYVGKVKLCYIDPPFNTGETFKDYDDAVEHSVWLTMLRDRLVQIRRLLTDDGSVWVHLDDAEQHRARSVLDEVFGAENFVATLVWQKADSPRMDAKQFSFSHDYVHVYSKKPGWQPNRREQDAVDEATFPYVEDDGRRFKSSPLRKWGTNSARADRPNLWYPITGPDGQKYWPIKPDGTEGNWRWQASTVEKNRHRLHWIDKGSGMQPYVKEYADAEKKPVPPITWWSNDLVGHNRSAKAHSKQLFGKNSAFATPKPEQLLAEVLFIGTQVGDLVLDCFSGSGTTAAVAHKMGRRYVTVELSEDNLNTYVRPRLEKVAKGEDPGGISRSVDWTGGGGYRVLKVASSMFEADEDGDLFLADWAVGGELARAVCAQVRYEYEPAGPFTGHKGRSRLAVLDGMLTAGVAELLLSKLADKETLLVVAQAIEPGAEELLSSRRGGSKVRKMPRDLARRGILPSRLVTLTSTPDGATS